MFLKWLIFVSILSVLNARDGASYRLSSCITPRLIHGRFRSRGVRNRVVKFTCLPGYELVGERYSTCRNGMWDTPVPKCVQAGCSPPHLDNGLMVPSHNGAWVVFFCLPGYELNGSPTIYCDGEKWNDTAPTCTNSKTPPPMSCDFEDEDLCGWKQDYTHDFDWIRRNKKTPSSFLYTGPSHDHTFGATKDGHYMYIESSSRDENDTARLLSPIYDKSLAVDGCFSFYYHMYGKSIGGLRVYQRPTTMSMVALLNMPDQLKENLLLFEMWGNQGDEWYGDVSPLYQTEIDFQIVIEGIRGRSFTSDIAIDDVAILQGASCLKKKQGMATPQTFLPESCEDRCTNSTAPQLGCSCSWMCVVDKNCCGDFFDVCITGNDWTASSTTTDTTVEETESVSETSTSTTIRTVPTTKKITTTEKVNTTLNIRTTKKLNTTEQLATAKTIPKTVNTVKNVTANTTTVETKVRIDVKQNYSAPAKVFNNATKNTYTRPASPVTLPTKRTTVPVIIKNTTVTYKPKPTIRSEPKYRKNADEAKKTKEETLESKSNNMNQSSAWGPILIAGAVLLCCGGLVWVVVGMRGARGRVAFDYLRGRTRHDPEVRYLHANSDDELN